MIDTAVRDGRLRVAISERCSVLTHEVHLQILLACALAQRESADVFEMVFKHDPESLGSCNMHFVIKSRILRMMQIQPCGDFTRNG